MPASTMEMVQKRAAKLKQALKGLGESPDVAEQRKIAKQLRRAQRRRRRMAAEVARAAKKAKPAEASAE